MTKRQRAIRLYLCAYLRWLCHLYRTDIPPLYISFRENKIWHTYNQRYSGKVAGFYNHEDHDNLPRGVYILASTESLSISVSRLRHEWRHHWQYLYRKRIFLWWKQHEPEYIRLHDRVVCAIEVDAHNFQFHQASHRSARDEQLLAAFSEDELSKLESVFAKRTLAIRASEIYNADKMHNKVSRVAWVEQSPADFPEYRSGWKGKKVLLSSSITSLYCHNS